MENFNAESNAELSEIAMTSEGFGLTSDRVAAQAPSLPTNAALGADLREKGWELASSLNQQTRSNPWLTVGIVGVGALALGYIFGRRMPVDRVAPEVRGIARENDRYEKFSGYAD